MSILRVSISRFKAIISKCEILLHGRSENLHFLHCVVSSSSSGDKQQIDIKYKISPACLAKYKIYRDCGWGQRERAIYRVCTAPVSSPPRTTATCCGKVSRAGDHRGAGHGGTQVVLRWYSRWYSGGTPGGQCGAAVFRLLSTASTANLSHIVNTIISCAATRAWRRDQTGNKVWGTSRTCLTQEIDAMFNCKHCMYLKVLETRDDEQFYAMVESGLYLLC